MVEGTNLGSLNHAGGDPLIAIASRNGELLG